MSGASDVAEEFYSALAAHDPAAMGALYADDAVFSDPVFPRLDAAGARAMWSMLLRPGVKLAVVWRLLNADENSATVEWTARYIFPATGRPVTNRVTSELEIADGLIRRHRDTFSFHHWARQALGLPGLLLGWAPILKARVEAQAAARLAAYREKRP
jgi:ketosteroid isomerase-like protein